MLRKAHPVARRRQTSSTIRNYFIEDTPDLTGRLRCLRQYEGIVRDAQLCAIRESEASYLAKRRTETALCELQLLSSRKQLVFSPLETVINE